MAAKAVNARETCPACKGQPTSPMFIDGPGLHQVIQLTCPYCGGSGSIVAGRSAWAEIGDRLRRSREATQVGVMERGGQKLLTMHRDVKLVSMPIEIAANKYRIPDGMLYAIEAGRMDPSIIADRVDKVPPECLVDVDRQLALPI